MQTVLFSCFPAAPQTNRFGARWHPPQRSVPGGGLTLVLQMGKPMGPNQPGAAALGFFNTSRMHPAGEEGAPSAPSTPSAPSPARPQCCLAKLLSGPARGCGGKHRVAAAVNI